MKKIRFFKHGPSTGCMNLVRELKNLGVDAKVLRNSENSRYVWRSSHIIVNWGSSSFHPRVPRELNVLNHPIKVKHAVNKIHTFQRLQQTLSRNIPEWTTSQDVAHEWVVEEGKEVYCRQSVEGHGGIGIVLATSGEQVRESNARLFTVKVPVDREFRVHIFNGRVIDYSQKKRVGKKKREENNILLNEDIRNHKNGWIFARAGVSLPEEAKTLVKNAMYELGLFFGAFDIIWTPQEYPVILEVNTAPGIEGSTAEAYAEAFYSYILGEDS